MFERGNSAILRKRAYWRDPISVATPRLGGRRPAGRRPTGSEPGKRALDITLCLLAFPVAVPVGALCALLIVCTNPGPVFYRQQRTGYSGRRFPMVKFRTMVRDADQLKARYAELNTQDGPDFKVPDDPRVTRIGHILRRTSLDELPQLLNVLHGEMSLVGPRPTSFAPSTYAPWHTERLEVTPGLTGLWQVSGRSELGFDERVRLDIAYVRERSLWMDLHILVRTVGAVIGGRGAY